MPAFPPALAPPSAGTMLPAARPDGRSSWTATSQAAPARTREFIVPLTLIITSNYYRTNVMDWIDNNKLIH